MGLAWFLKYWWGQRLEHSQDNPIRNAARKYRLEPALIKAVVWRESYFNPKVLGKAGEYGLMQIREDAAREWAEAEHIDNFDPESLIDPYTNTLAGTWYLRKLLSRYQNTDNPLPYGLADYNAGRGNVLRWNKGDAKTNSFLFMQQMDYPGTRRYIELIADRCLYYKPVFQ